MRFEMFVHNDEVTCFHMAVKGTQKVIVMDCHDFKDEVLIKNNMQPKKQMREVGS